ncbi:MAG: hypothetical protein V5A88_05495 [Candidatus Thermoplasmatota archaeon]
MDEEDKMLEKLDERLAKGEISEELYKEILSRYQKDEGKEKNVEDIDEEVDIDIEELEEREKEKEETESVEHSSADDHEKTRRVSISGATKIDGCNCEIFRAAGASKVNGEMRADDAKASGATKIDGDVYVGTLKSSGALKVSGKTEGERLKLDGSSKFKRGLKVERIDFSGSFKVQGDVNCDIVKGSGSINIRDTLKGEEISLGVSGKSKIKKIEGGDVVVESEGLGFFFGLGKSGSLEVESIRGDDIYLENTKAKNVTGDKVVIGQGCKIDTVKAKDLKVHESATVGNKQSLKEIKKK